MTENENASRNWRMNFPPSPPRNTQESSSCASEESTLCRRLRWVWKMGESFLADLDASATQAQDGRTAFVNLEEVKARSAFALEEMYLEECLGEA